MAGTGVTGSDYRAGSDYQIALCTVSAEVNRVRVSVRVRVSAAALYGNLSPSGNLSP